MKSISHHLLEVPVCSVSMEVWSWSTLKHVSVMQCLLPWFLSVSIDIYLNYRCWCAWHKACYCWFTLSSYTLCSLFCPPCSLVFYRISFSLIISFVVNKSLFIVESICQLIFSLLSSLQVESTHKRPLLFQEHQSISRNLWYTFNSVSCNASPTMHLLHHISDCLFRSNKHVMYTLSRTYYIMLLNWNIEAYNNVWIM